jgi:hypothetical protein
VKRSTIKILWRGALRKISTIGDECALSLAETLLKIKGEPQTKRMGENIFRIVERRRAA